VTITIKTYRLDDHQDVHYYVGAETSEGAVEFVKEDYKQMGLDPTELEVTSLTEVDGAAITVYHEEKEAQVSLDDIIREYGPGILGCSEW